MSGASAGSSRSLIVVFLLLLVALPSLGQGTRPAKEGEDAGERDRPAERERYFRRGRTLRGESGAALRHRAYQQKLSKRAQSQASPPSTQAPASQPSAPTQGTPAGSPWESLGPAPIGVDPSSGQDFGVNSGRVTTVVVDQNDASGNTVYVGGAYGGVWKSTNAANPSPANVQWTPLIDDQPTLAVGAIALKPDDSNTILVGTGESNSSGDSYYGLGILRSTDGGNTWELITSADNGTKSFKGLAFSKIAFSTDNTSLVVASTTNSNSGTLGIDTSNIRGIYYSTDAGATWQYAGVQDSGVTITPASTSSVIYHRTLHKFFAAVRFHGIYSSVDGVTWSRLAIQPGGAVLSTTACPPAVLTTCPIQRGEIAIQPVTGDLYVWYIDGNLKDRGIFKTSNGGSTWLTVGTSGIDSCGDQGGCGTIDQGDYDLEIAAVPNGTGTDLYAGAINIYKCSLAQNASSCTSWLNLTHVYGCTVEGAPAHVHPDQHSLSFPLQNPNLIYFGHDGGVSRALNGPGLLGGTCSSHNAFDDLSGTLGSLTEFVSFSQHPTDDSTVLGGAQDVGSSAVDSTHPGSGLGWMNVNAGDGGFNVINPSNPLEWFTANTDVSIQRCTQGINCNAGVGFATITIGNSKVGNDHGDFYTPYILDPGMPSHIIIGTCRVWRGNSDGSGWSSANVLTTNFDTSTATTCTGAENNLVSALAAGGPVSNTGTGGSQVIYAGTNAGNIFVTTNASGGASTWSMQNVTPFGYKISDIAIDPSDPTGRTAYATLMNFGSGHVLKTTAAGFPWQNITGDLPDAPADSVVVDPNDPTIIYVGTDVGVFVTMNGGVNWTEWGTGLPNAPVTRIRGFASQDGSKNKLRASTYGRGVWQTDLFTATPFRASVSPASLATFVGDPATFTVTVIAQAKFSGTVTVSCDGGGNPLPSSCVGATVSPTTSGTPVTVTASDPSVADFSFSLKVVAPDANSTTVELPVVLHTVDVSVSAPSPASLVIKRGTMSVPVVFTVTGFGPLQSTTTLSCSGMPNGTTCEFQPSPFLDLANGSTADVTMVVHSTLTADLGTFTPSIVATNQLFPADTRTQTFTLEVDLNPDFTLAANPTILTPNALTSTITVASRDGYAGTVNLTCSVDQPGPICSIPVTPVSSFPSQVHLTINPNGTVAGTFVVTVSGNDGNHTNSIQLSLVFPDYILYMPNGTTSTGFSGGTGSFSFYVEGINFYAGQVLISCDSTAIDPSSTCSANPPSVTGQFTNVIITYTVPSSVTAGNFPVHILTHDATGAPVHNADITAGIQGFILAAIPPTSLTGVKFDTYPTYNVAATPTGGYSDYIAFHCAGNIPYCGSSSGSLEMLSSPRTIQIVTLVPSDAPPGVYGNGTIPFTLSASPLRFPAASVPVPGNYSLQIQDFRVTMPNRNISMLAGTSAQIPLVVESFGTNASSTLGCTGAPPGATCTFNPSTIGPAGGTSVMTISVPSTAPLTNYATYIRTTGTAGSRSIYFYLWLFNLSQSVAPVSANVPPGGSANFTVSYSAQNFSGPTAAVAVGCGNLPAGASCTANPPQVVPGQPSTVTLTTTAGVTPPTSTFSITGTALGVTKSTSVTLRVVDFSLTSTTSSASVNVGTMTPVSLRATAQNGFNSSVTLTCPPVAAGISCTFSPSTFTPLSTGTVVSASILTTAATPPGIYSVPLTATGNGVSHVVNFTLTVKDFHVSVQPSTAITPVGGGKATYALTLFADQGFNSLVTLSCGTPLPTGVTCAFVPATVTPTVAGVTSTLTVTVLATTPKASNTLTIRATASPLVVTQNVTLMTGADFSLATVTGPQTVQQTQNADFHITATAIGGMNQPVTLSCSGLPAGASCSFSQNPVTPLPGGQDVDVTVMTTLASVPNPYTITVQGAGGGVTHTTPLSLNLQFFPDFVLSSGAPLAAVRPGQTAMFNAASGKNGAFTSIVDLSCAGALPAGASCQVQPASVDFSVAVSAPVTVSATTPGNTPLADSMFSLHGVERGGTKVHDLPLTLRVNDYHLSAPTPLTFAQTDTASYTVTVFADNQFSGPVTLSCNNLPANVGPCNFSANNFVPGAAGTPVTVTAPVGANASVGQTSFDVVVSGGNTSHTVTEPLNLILVQDFTFASLAAPMQTTTPGQTIGWPLALTPLNSFAANISFNIAGCPAGFVCSIAPPPPIAISNQIQQVAGLLVQVPATVAAVNSNITVTATDPVSGKTHAVTVILSVQNFSLTISPTSRSVPPGAGGMYNVTLTGLNGFTQQVLIACFNPPVGVTCSAAVASPGNTVPLTVMTASNITSGAKTIAIGGALVLGAPPNLNLRNVSLVVSPSTPTYFLTTTAATKVAPVGTSAIFTLNVRASTTTFISPVSLSCLGNQFSCVFSPATVTPNTVGTNLTLTATPANPLSPGSYPLTVQALGGVQVRQLALTINVADFAIVTNSSPQTILNPNGGTANYVITLFTQSGFNSAVTLTCPGNPAGVTCAFVPASVTPTPAGATSTLTITTTAASQKGQLNLTVQGTGAGLTRQLPIQLTNGQDFQLTATPTTISVPPGGNNSISIAANAIGPFATAVVLACVGVNPPPAGAGINCTFPSGAMVSPGSSVPLQLSATSNLPGGTYTLTVQGIADGLTHTVPVTVTVPDYSLGLALAPGFSDVLVGASPGINGTVTAIAGFSGAINLSCVVAAPLSCIGFPVSPITPTANGTPYSFSVTVPNGTSPGAYPLQINADDGAGHLHTANLSLVVKDFSVALNTASGTIEAGTSTTVSGAVAGMNGFIGNVQLSCAPDPNISCVFTPQTLAASAAGTPFSVTIAAAPVTPPNPYTVNIQGISAGATRGALFNLTVTPTNDFNVAIAQPSQTINAGESASFGLQVTPVNAFNATVTISCTGAPAGMTCTPPAPFPVPPGGNFNVPVQTTLGVIAPGTYNLTLTSSGGGKTHNQALSVTVQDFTLSLTPPSQQVLPGSGADYSVAMNSSSGFANTAQLTCSISGSPAGAACKFDQSSLTAGGSTTLHVTTIAATPPGPYTITATATSNVTAHSATAAIQVGGPDFSLSSTSTSLNLAPGGSVKVPVTVTALFGFNTSVSFTCSSNGAGVSCTAPAGLTPSPAGTVISFPMRASGHALPNTYQIALTGTGGGKTHTLGFTLNVQ